jgi:CPA1 family monovalent cation:H+ antiporter
MAENILLAALLLAFAVAVAGIFRRLPVPDSVVLVIAGMLISELSRRWAPAGHLSDLHLSPELVVFVLLPALVFESGLNLDTRQLLKNLAPIVTLAVPALLLSSALVGGGLWLVAGLDPLIALLFGALICATDPVAVVALFRETGAPARLTVLVEGESLFNDATAIVVFGMLLGMIMSGVAPGAGTLLGALPEFVAVFVGGALLGAVFGAVASEITHRLRSPTPSILAMSLAAAYLSFIVAEHSVHVSGVMAAVGAAITFGALGVTRLTRDTARVLGETWELLAFVCNALLFLLIGMAVDVASLLSRWHLILVVASLLSRWHLILVAVVLVHAARAVAVYGLLPLATRAFALPTVTRGERHIMWWGGLKGGLAVAIALSVPESVPERQLVLDVTVGVVLFTLLVNATTLRPLMHRLRLDRLSDDERAELDDALAAARARVEHELDSYRGQRVLSAAAHHRLAETTVHSLAPARRETRGEDAPRAPRLSALRAEATALAWLYESRAIDQYTFLELRDLLVRERESAAGERADATRAGGPLRRVEAALLRRLRERDWAAGLLSRYQSLRLIETLNHNLGGVVMAEAALAALDAREDRDEAPVRELIERYRERAARRRARLSELRREFPDFMHGFEERTFRRAALVGALRAAQREHQHGELGDRAFAGVSRRIVDALQQAPQQAAVSRARPRELMSRVALFQGLAPETLEAVATEARPVTFLPGDVVVGEGEHGDALYVVTRGRVRVTRRDAGGAPHHVADLRDGDILGEAALLGAPVRNATVTASAPSTLLRLTRSDVLALADRHPEIGERLRRIDRARHGEGEESAAMS